MSRSQTSRKMRQVEVLMLQTEGTRNKWEKTSLEVQWLRICLAVQGTWSNYAHMPQRLSLHAAEPVSHNGRAHALPGYTPCDAFKAPRAATKTRQSQIKKEILKKRWEGSEAKPEPFPGREQRSARRARRPAEAEGVGRDATTWGPHWAVHGGAPGPRPALAAPRGVELNHAATTPDLGTLTAREAKTTEPRLVEKWAFC